jgi:DNA invertase Pin-like site-specific DNA recombinase
LRVSTTDQDTERQERELRAVAAHRGYDVVGVYKDNGVSGSKGRDKRPAFDALHKDAARHRFDIVMVWSVDRLGRSLKDLVGFLHKLLTCNVDLNLHQQALDATTPSGRAMFQLLGVFAEFERAMIAEPHPLVPKAVRPSALVQDNARFCCRYLKGRARRIALNDISLCCRFFATRAEE